MTIRVAMNNSKSNKFRNGVPSTLLAFICTPITIILHILYISSLIIKASNFLHLNDQFMKTNAARLAVVNEYENTKFIKTYFDIFLSWKPSTKRVPAQCGDFNAGFHTESNLRDALLTFIRSNNMNIAVSKPVKLETVIDDVFVRREIKSVENYFAFTNPFIIEMQFQRDW
ncbi:uncharacterized protein BX663DRAFT_487044 [Cokeromyces recurvatus]|uniref:uncharacterized protein n=1 Tax=Cokeromyces recurvatus TaxID=90255 RepID=UPI00221E3CFD|nr:uncharacterized protein BX663DRAFT_487044 [Cokeromyces recurvatus]KAI7902255.1 hypothetical protein BX663DRAFT_487044 [Cokeromyces recurvatus]